jgi:hypothetical protein
MTYKVKTKKGKGRTAYELRVGDDVVRANSMRELNKKLEEGVILWRTPIDEYKPEVRKLKK